MTIKRGFGGEVELDFDVFTLLAVTVNLPLLKTDVVAGGALLVNMLLVLVSKSAIARDIVQFLMWSE